MTGPCESCPQREVHDVQFRSLEGKLKDLKERVAKMESVLARGTLLLVANLVGVAMTLAQGYITA